MGACATRYCICIIAAVISFYTYHVPAVIVVFQCGNCVVKLPFWVPIFLCCYFYYIILKCFYLVLRVRKWRGRAELWVSSIFSLVLIPKNIDFDTKRSFTYEVLISKQIWVYETSLQTDSVSWRLMGASELPAFLRKTQYQAAIEQTVL